MKTKLLTALMLLFIGVRSYGQTLNSFIPIETEPSELVGKFKRAKSNNRNSSCSTDTLLYSLVKEQSFNAVPKFYGISLISGSGTIASASQAYTVSAPTNITGVSFYARVKNAVNPSQPASVSVAVYNVDLTLKPTTIINSSVPVVINGTTTDLYSVDFPQTIVPTGNYAIVLSNSSITDTVTILINNAQTTTYGEGLAYYEATGSWFTPKQALGGNAAYEPIVAAIVTYPIATDYTVSSNPACVGSAVNFTNTSTPMGLLNNRMYNFNVFFDYYSSASDSTFQWDFGDGSPNSYGTNSTHTYTGTGLPTVILNTRAGFWNSCIDSKSMQIVVNPNPIITVNSTTICNGQPATLTANGGTTYSWSSGGTDSLITVSPSANASYTVTGTAGGCSSTAVSNITVNPVPSVNSNSITVCVGSSGTLTATPSVSGGTYAWSTGVTTGAITESPLTTTTYTVTYTLNGCSSNTTGIITVKPNPASTFSFDATNAPTITFTASASATTYSWDFGDGSPLGTTMNPSHTYTTNGTYTVTLTVTDNGCSSTTISPFSITIYNVGISEDNFINTVKLYPNPTNGLLKLELNSPEKTKVEIVNVLGEIVYSSELNSVSTIIDLSALNKGIYQAKISNLKGIAVKQIVLNK